MRWIAVWTVAALGCGAVDERLPCGASADCPVGQYCARAEGTSGCWPDAAPPSVSAVTVTCADPCLRDGLLRVAATAADDAEVLDVSVALDLDPGRAFPMTREGDAWVADVPLRELPFEAFARDVVATVTARDGARNVGEPRVGEAVRVTRLRWARALDPDAVVSPTAPAVKADGTVVVGGSNAKVYFIASEGTDAGPALAVGTGQITAAPAIGQHAIWVGSEDFSLRAVKLDGSGVISGAGASAGGAVRGGVAVVPQGTKEWSFATSAGGYLAAASNVPSEYAVAGPTGAFALAPVLGQDARSYVVSATGALRAYRLNTAPAITLTELWNVPVGVNVSAPLAVDAGGAIWSGSQDGKLNRTTPSGATETMATLTASISDSPVILEHGDVVVGDGSGALHRVTPQKTIAWSRKLNGDPAVDEPLGAPLVLARASATLLVPTRTGVLYALDAAGNEVWRHALAAGAELRAPNLHTPPGQQGPTLSHAYVSSANGWLFSIVVDGALDAAAPWPKAFHDPRNTNRAGPQP